MASSGGVDVPHGSKRSLYPTGHLSQQSLKVGHSLLVYHDPTSLVVRISITEHEHVLHHRLRQKVGLFRSHRRTLNTKKLCTDNRLIPGPSQKLTGHFNDISADPCCSNVWGEVGATGAERGAQLFLEVGNFVFTNKLKLREVPGGKMNE